MSPFYGNSRILIFGSAVKENKFNDIDILIIGDGDAISDALKKFGRTYSVKFHIVQARAEELTQAFVSELRKKHMILNGHELFLEVLFDELKPVRRERA